MGYTCIIDDEIVSPLGFSTQANLLALSENKSAVSLIDDSAISAHPFYGSKFNDLELEKQFASLKQASAYTRLEKLMILALQPILERHPELNLDKTQLIVATTKGNIDVWDTATNFPENRVKLNVLAQQLQAYFQIAKKPIVVSNACISGALAVGVGKRMLASDASLENVLVVAGDLLSKFVVSGFQSFQALADARCLPYDKHRNGINLGEATAAVLLQQKNQLKPTDCYISGEASANDANHISGPSRTAEGLVTAIQQAFQETQLEVDSPKIDYISAHGTATPYNDEMEAIAFKRLQLTKVPVNSYKAYFGHTLGASGLLESILCKHSLHQNKVHQSLGYTTQGTSIPLAVITSNQAVTLNRVLKTASGFGGCNYAMILEKQT